MSIELMHPILGRVVVTRRRNSRRASARFQPGLTTVSIPTYMTDKGLSEALDYFATHIPSNVAQRHTLPPEINTAAGTIVIGHQDTDPAHVLRRTLDDGGIHILLPHGMDADREREAVEHILRKYLRTAAVVILADETRIECRRLGLRTVIPYIGYGTHRLGFCTSRGRISLSCMLLLLDRDLRRYVICHELAHLTHHNHSQQFHRLLDSYLDGRERELTRRLRAFSWPL